MKKIKVLVNAIALTNVHTGISRYASSLYSEILKRHAEELDVTFFDGCGLCKEMPGGPVDQERWSRMTDLFWKLPPTLGVAIRMLYQRKREILFHRLVRGFDVYHEPGFFPFRVPASVRTVFTIHDMSVHRHPECHPRERVLFYKLLFAKRSALASEVLTVSNFSKSEILHYTDFRPDRIAVTPLGYDPRIFHPVDHGNGEAVLEELGLPPLYFLFLGTGDPRKNLDVIPKALRAANLDIPLVVVGWPGWDAKGLPEKTIPLGFLPDNTLRVVIASARALIFPSFYEGFGLPVLEAMACGCPVVTSRAASMPEIGGDAVLYLDDPSDAQGLGRLLAWLAVDDGLRDFLRAAGLSRAALFPWANTADKSVEVFRKACGRI